MPAPHPWQLPPRSIPAPSPSEPHGRSRIPTPARRGARSTPGPPLTRAALVCLGNLCFLGKVLLEQPRPTRAAPLGRSGQRSHLSTGKEWGHSHSQPGSPGMSKKHQKPPVPPPVLRSAKPQVRFPAPVPRAPIATSQRPQLSAALLLAGFVFGFQLDPEDPL